MPFGDFGRMDFGNLFDVSGGYRPYHEPERRRGMLNVRNPLEDYLTFKDPLSEEMERIDRDAVLEEENKPGFLKRTVNYISSTLGKPGRPIRAGIRLLMGKDAPKSELLAWVPFSDTAGFTNAEDEVRGEDLAKDFGIIDDNTGGLGKFAAGFALDMLTDPTTLVGGFLPKVGSMARTTRAANVGAKTSTAAPSLLRRIGSVIPGVKNLPSMSRQAHFVEQAASPLLPVVKAIHPETLTKAGKLINSLSDNALLPVSNLARLRGFKSLEEVPEELLRHAGSLARTAPGSEEAKILADVISGAASGKWMPLQGTNFRIPFTGIGTTLGDTPLGQLGAALLTGGQSIMAPVLMDTLPTAFRAIPGAKALISGFSGKSGGMPDLATQALHRDYVAPAVEAAKLQYGKLSPTLQRAALKWSGGNPDRLRPIYDQARNMMEGFGNLNLASSMSGQELAAADRMARYSRSKLDSIAQDLMALGELAPDSYRANYYPRSMTGMGGATYARGASMAAGAGGSAAVDLSRKLNVTTEGLGLMAADPLLSGTHAGSLSTMAGTGAGGAGSAAADYIRRTYGSHLPGTAASDAEDLAHFLSTLDKSHRAGVPLVGNTMVGDIERYTTKAAGLKGRAEGVQDYILDSAFDSLVGKTAGDVVTGGQVGLIDGLKRLGYKVDGNAKMLDSLADRLSRRLGAAVDPRELGKFSINTDTFQTASRLLDASSKGGVGETLVGKIYDSVTNAFKTLSVTPWVGSQALNVVGNIWKSLMHGIHDPTEMNPVMRFLSPWINSVRVVNGWGVIPGLSRKVKRFAGMTDEEATAKLTAEAMATGELGRQGHHASDIALNPNAPFTDELLIPQMPGSIAGAHDWNLPFEFRRNAAGNVVGVGVSPNAGRGLNPMNMRGVRQSVGPKREVVHGQAATRTDNFLLRGAEVGMEYADRVSRMAHYIGRTLQGLDPTSAHLSSLAAHGGWEMLTPFERNTVRRLIPFYTWARGNAADMLELIARKPGAVQATLRVKDNMNRSGMDEGEYMPHWLKDRGAAQQGEDIVYIDPVTSRLVTKKKYVSLPQDPATQGVQWLADIAGGVTGDTDSLYRLGSSLNPLIKLPVESMLGKDLFTRGDIEAMNQSHRWEEENGPLVKALRYSPFSRLQTALKNYHLQKRQGDLSSGEIAANMLLGPVVRVVDMERAKQRDYAKIRERQALEIPGVREFKELGMPPEQQYRLYGDPGAMQAMRAMQNIGMRQRITSLESKLEEMAKEGLPDTRMAEEARTREMLYRLQLQDLREKMMYETGIPGVKIPRKRPYAPMIGVLQRQAAMGNMR